LNKHPQSYEMALGTPDDLVVRACWKSGKHSAVLPPVLPMRLTKLSAWGQWKPALYQGHSMDCHFCYTD